MSITRALLVATAIPLLASLAGCKEKLLDGAEPPCENCGVVESVVAREIQGEGTGKGAVAGAIVGGVVGHQFGSGSGNDAATVAGAAGGAVAGHHVEKEMNKRVVYEVTVRMEKGGIRHLMTFDQPPTVREGDRVVVSGDRIRRV